MLCELYLNKTVLKIRIMVAWEKGTRELSRHDAKVLYLVQGHGNTGIYINCQN